MCTENKKTKHVQKTHHPRKTPPTQKHKKTNTKHKKLILFYCRKKHSFLQQKQSQQTQTMAEYEQQDQQTQQTQIIENQVKAWMKNPVPPILLKIFKQSLQTHIMTTRFTDTTYRRNAYYRNYPTIANQGIKCIYGSQFTINTVPHGHMMYMLEMNNTTNKIMGIGKVRNVPRHKEYKLYQKVERNKEGYRFDFNLYSYPGEERIDCEVMDEEDLEVIRVLEMVCFTGRTHLKRSLHITRFPVRILFQLHQEYNIHDKIHAMFEKYQQKKDPLQIL